MCGKSDSKCLEATVEQISSPGTTQKQQNSTRNGVGKQPEATGEFVAKMNMLNLYDWAKRMLEAKILFMLLSR